MLEEGVIKLLVLGIKGAESLFQPDNILDPTLNPWSTLATQKRNHTLVQFIIAQLRHQQPSLTRRHPPSTTQSTRRLLLLLLVRSNRQYIRRCAITCQTTLHEPRKRIINLQECRHSILLIIKRSCISHILTTTNRNLKVCRHVDHHRATCEDDQVLGDELCDQEESELVAEGALELEDWGCGDDPCGDLEWCPDPVHSTEIVAYFPPCAF